MANCAPRARSASTSSRLLVGSCFRKAPMWLYPVSTASACTPPCFSRGCSYRYSCGAGGSFLCASERIFPFHTSWITLPCPAWTASRPAPCHPPSAESGEAPIPAQASGVSGVLPLRAVPQAPPRRRRRRPTSPAPLFPAPSLPPRRCPRTSRSPQPPAR